MGGGGGGHAVVHQHCAARAGRGWGEMHSCILVRRKITTIAVVCASCQLVRGCIMIYAASIVANPNAQ